MTTSADKPLPPQAELPGFDPDAELVAEFEVRRERRLAGSWGSYAPRNPIASDQHDCLRYGVMRQLAWRVRDVPDARGMATIENGRVQEPAMIHQLQDEGWDVVEFQAPFEIRQPVEKGGPRRLIVRGNLDGKIRIGRERIPFDTKDTSEHVLDRLHTEADLQETLWTRKWWRQLQLYMLGEENERGLLILGFRGRRRVIVCHLDYEVAEQLLQRCAWTVAMVEELENQGVDEKTVDRALWERAVAYHQDFTICKRCPFHERSCFPPQPAPGASQVREDLAQKAARFAELRPLSGEYKRLGDQLKETTEGYPQTVAGDFVIEGQVRTRKHQAREATPERVSEHWSISVRRAGEGRGA